MKHIVILILTLIIFASCQDDFSSTEIIIPENPVAKVQVKTSVFGKIVDLTGSPIPNTEVVLAGETQISNELGFFQFDGLQVDRYGSLLSAEKSGYFTGLRRVSLYAGTSNYVELMLLEDTPYYNFESGTASIIEDVSGLKLNFDANSIATQDGQIYNGTVNVALQYIDPTADNIISTLPGSLQGLTSGNSLASLKSYSMIAVELTNDRGEELQVKNGATVAIEFPVPVDLLRNAPNQIPLWYLNENNGLWVEEGSADLVGDKYVGEVSHFSFWNCDVPEDFVIVEGSVCNTISGSCQALAFSEIQVLDADNEVRLVSKTDSEGNFTIFIPKNAEVTVDFIRICDSGADQAIFGPFSENQNVGVVEINANIDDVQIDADVFNCDGGLLDVGFALINDVYVPVVNGTFSTKIFVCDESDITIVAFNEDFTKGSAVTTVSYSESINTSFSLCEENVQEEYITLKITNDDTGKVTNHAFFNNRYQPCGEITTTESFPDSMDIVTSDFVSSLVSGGAFEGLIDTQSVYVSFDHGDSCNASDADVELVFVNATVFLSDGFYHLTGFVDLFGTNVAGVNIISEYNLKSFGQNIGDVIEGSMKVENLIAIKVNLQNEGPLEPQESEDRYSMEVNFKVTVSQ